jgi:chemotaxis-related protein WspB
MLVLTFTAGTDRYGVDVAQVVEVVPRVELRPIPHAPAFLAGLLAYRGQVVPIIDLGSLLGSTPCQDRLSTRIILVSDAPVDHNRRKAIPSDAPVDSERMVEDGNQNKEKSPQFLGLIAEHVSDLTAVPSGQVVVAPVHLAQAPYFRVIAQTGQGMIPLIEVSALRRTLVSGP